MKRMRLNSSTLPINHLISIVDSDRRVRATSSRRLVAFALLATVGLAIGCDGSGTENDAVWPANAAKMVATDLGGGFVGPAPAGSDCSGLGVGTYTFTIADSKLAWHVCQSTGGQPYHNTDGARVLSSNETAMLVAALKAVTISTRTTCGADKGDLKLSVTTPADEKTYLDDFYACSKNGVYVSDIDGVFTASTTLAH